MTTSAIRMTGASGLGDGPAEPPNLASTKKSLFTLYSFKPHSKLFNAGPTGSIGVRYINRMQQVY